MNRWFFAKLRIAAEAGEMDAKRAKTARQRGVSADFLPLSLGGRQKVLASRKVVLD